MKSTTGSGTASNSPEILPAGTLEPPMISLYGVLAPEAVAVARALRDPDDAAELYRRIRREDLGSGNLSRLFERACFQHLTGRGGEPELLEALARARSPLRRLALHLAQIPDWVLAASGTPTELATVIVRGPLAFRPPRRPRSAAA
jgi:hypothetical protein